MNFYRVGDTLPVFDIHVRDSGAVIPLDNPTKQVMVRWQRPDGSEIAEREALPDGDPADGNAFYEWTVGDISIAGVYRAIMRLKIGADYLSLLDPPVTEMEALSSDFAPTDATMALIPSPSLMQVAYLMGVDPGSLDGTATSAQIDRARRDAYVYTQMWRCPGHSLEGMDGLLMQDLVAELTAWRMTVNPAVTYGPYQKETMGSYSYDRGSRTAAEGAFTGIPRVDSIIDYFQRIFKSCDSTQGISIMYPEWWSPVTERLWDPTLCRWE